MILFSLFYLVTAHNIFLTKKRLREKPLTTRHLKYENRLIPEAKYS